MFIICALSVVLAFMIIFRKADDIVEGEIGPLFLAILMIIGATGLLYIYG